MALDKLTLLDETIINSTATTAATTVVNNSAQTNYISYPVAVGNPLTNGWRVYFDGAAVAPVDGASGTTTITVTQNTVTPLNSTGDFRLTKTSGASRQGEGFSTDFTIANRHLGKVLQASFDYEVISGTLATDDIRFYIIQDPGGTNTVIEPVGVSLQGSAAPTVGNPTIRLRHIATFQTHISVTSYRLCIHIATTTNSLQVIDFNGFRVWEPIQSIGAVITDWVNYTPTFTNLGTVTNINIQWRRVGSNLEVRGNFTSGTVSVQTNQAFTFPSGLVSNVGWSSGDGMLVGYITTNLFSEARTAGLLARNDNLIRFGGIVGWSNNSYNNVLSALNLAVVGSNEFANFYFSVPIIGWGSSVAMSSDTGDSRVIAGRATVNNTLSVTANQPIAWQSVVYDTHAGFSSGRYTVPVSGYYQIFSATYSGTAAGTLYAAVDGVMVSQGGPLSALYEGTFVSDTIFVRAGQIVDIRLDATVTLQNISPINRFSIVRVSAGSQVIASSETVACEVWTDTTTTASSSTNFIFNRVNRDTHGAWNTTTGIYTAPMSGWYNFSLMINPNTSPTSGTIDLYKASVGGSFTKYKMLAYLISGSSFPSGIGSVYLLAGEQISFRYASGSFTAYGTSTLASNSSWLTINRVGN